MRKKPFRQRRPFDQGHDGCRFCLFPDYVHRRVVCKEDQTDSLDWAKNKALDSCSRAYHRGLVWSSPRAICSRVEITWLVFSRKTFGGSFLILTDANCAFAKTPTATTQTVIRNILIIWYRFGTSENGSEATEFIHVTLIVKLKRSLRSRS